MVKLLRKYNKYILVVGGSLLMVAFLIPQAFNTLMHNPDRMAYAFLGESKVSRREWERLDREYHALRKFNQSLVDEVLGCESTQHWLLLTREAAAAGLVGESGDGAAWEEAYVALEQPLMVEMAQQLYGQEWRTKAQDPAVVSKLREQAATLVARQRDFVMAESRMNQADFDTAMAKARGVARLVSTFETAPRLSDRRAEMIKRDRIERVAAESLRVPADRIAFAMPEPSEEDLAAHFAAYREADAAGGEFGFGYRLPRRLKLEWLTVDRAAVEQVVTPDPVEANKRWRNNRDEYPGEFAAQQARIEQEIKKETVDRIVSDMDITVRQELRRASARLEPDGAFKKLPQGWAEQRPRLEDVAQAVVKNIKANRAIDIPLPAVTTRTGAWLTESDLYSLPSIGVASVSLGAGRSLPFPMMAFMARELRTSSDESADIGLQVGLTSPDLVAVDASQSRSYFTIVDFRPESPADSLDEVRSKCVENVKRLKAFALLKDALPVYEGEAGGPEGLDAVKKLIDTEYAIPAAQPGQPGAPSPTPSALAVQKRDAFIRSDALSPDSGRAPGLREKVLKIAEKLDPIKPSSDTPADQRTASGANPKTLSVELVLVTGIQPLTQELSRAIPESSLAGVVRQEVSQFERDDSLRPFRLDAMKARWKFRLDASVESPDQAKPFTMPSPKRY